MSEGCHGSGEFRCEIDGLVSVLASGPPISRRHLQIYWIGLDIQHSICWRRGRKYFYKQKGRAQVPRFESYFHFGSIIRCLWRAFMDYVPLLGIDDPRANRWWSFIQLILM